MGKIQERPGGASMPSEDAGVNGVHDVGNAPNSAAGTSDIGVGDAAAGLGRETPPAGATTGAQGNQGVGTGGSSGDAVVGDSLNSERGDAAGDLTSSGELPPETSA